MTIKETEDRDKLLAQGQIEWLTPKQVNILFSISVSCLAKMRMNRVNLRFSKFGKFVRYQKSDVERFISDNMVEVAL